MSKPTKEVIRAFKHVKKRHPEVTIVVYNSQGMWQYMDENFQSPKFIFNYKRKNHVKFSILEKAADSLKELPCVFEI